MARKDDGDEGGKAAVIAALIANLGIAATKFIAAALSGSSAMLAEGFHSLVDTGNQGFMLLGMKRAKKEPDAQHPFGYGSEIYFWAFIVAVLLFSLGAGLSVYEGIHAILSGEEQESGVPWIPFAVLAIAFGFEGYSLLTAVREFNKVRKGRGVLRDLRDLKDPSIFVVLAEDSAACTGLIFAFLGVLLSWLTGNSVWDGAASILIGGLLGGVAVLLATEVKHLLIGEAADPDIVKAVQSHVEDIHEVEAVNELRTLHLGPREVLLTVSMDFADDVVSQRIEEIVTRLEERIREEFEIIHHVYLEVQSKGGHRKLADDPMDAAAV